ncbi:MAG: DUF4175 domain-containing protein [Polyangiaceae bacterium]
MSEPRSTPKELAAFASELRAAIRHRVAGGQTTLAIVVVAGAVVGASLLGRLGTHAARIGGFAIIAGVGALLLGVGLWARSRWRDARRAVVREVGRSNPALGAAIDRAVGLASRTAAVDGEPLPLATPDEVTIELAALHLERQLDKVKIEEVVARAEKRGVGAAWLSFAGMVAVFAAIAVDPARVLEGADVLVARGGRAPFELLLLDDLDVVATPPSYLAQHEIPLRQFTQTSQPRGTVLTVRGRPLHRGRKLVLTDGHEEIAFNDDGKGAVVARWTVVGSTRLRLAARFGDTLVYQHDALAVESIPDAPPAVKLAAAPRTVRLVDVNTVSLAYEASDDHGLLEIALVIRVGDREDRRTLSRPSGSRLERGAHELSTRDPVFRDQFVPIEVTVEAKDNDTVTGPKWGRSASVIVMPPLVGEPEAARYVELTKVRDALVDLLAPRVEAGELEDDQAASRVDAEKTAHKATVAQVERALERTFGGLKITGRTKRLVNGQMRRLELAESTFETEPTGKHFSELVATTEQVVLAVDAAARALGMTDAKDVAKRLASVADEAASASAVATLPDENARGKQRLTAALEVLTGGGRELAKLDELGADLGDVTRGGVGRIQRLADQSNYVEAPRRCREPRAVVAARDREHGRRWRWRRRGERRRRRRGHGRRRRRRERGRRRDREEQQRARGPGVEAPAHARRSAEGPRQRDHARGEEGPRGARERPSEEAPRGREAPAAAGPRRLGRGEGRRGSQAGRVRGGRARTQGFEGRARWLEVRARLAQRSEEARSGEELRL